MLVLLAYSNSLRNDFVWDDQQQIITNPNLRPDAPWRPLFATSLWAFAQGRGVSTSNYYRPLQMSSYRLVIEWFGLAAQPLHGLSLLLNVAAALAAFAVFFELLRNFAASVAAALLFAAHPVHTEAVDWISASGDIGCALFFLLAFYFYLRILPPRAGDDAARSSHSQRLLWGAALLMFVLALLWKETAIVLPLVVFTHAFTTGRAGARLVAAWKKTAPFLCVVAAYFVLRVWILGFFAIRQRNWEMTPLQFALSVSYLLAKYCWKLVFPLPLNAYYVFSPVRSFFDPRAIGGVLFLICAVAAIYYAFHRARLQAFAGVWVVVTLIPVMNLYGVGRNAFAERYLFLPSFGFCLLVAAAGAALAKRLPERVRVALPTTLLIVVLAWFATATFQRNPDWHDNATLFGKTLATSPDAPFVHFMVAAAQLDDASRSSSAEDHLLKTIALAAKESPPDRLDQSRAYENLVSLYSDRGDFARALDIVYAWRDAIPDDPSRDTAEGMVLLRSGKWQQAEALLRKALAVSPDDENVLSAMGILYRDRYQDAAQAEAYFSRALAIHTVPDNFRASLLNNLGGAYGDQQRYGEATEQFRAAVRIAPDDPSYHANLALALAAMGRVDEALMETDYALRLDPSYGPAMELRQRLSHRSTLSR